MAYYGTISRGRREIPAEDKQFLSDLGFDVAAYIGNGVYGCVFSGLCNKYAKKLVAIGPNEAHTSIDTTYFDPIHRSFVRELSLNGKPCAIKVFHDRIRWSDQLYNEAKVLCDLNHPNIVEIYSICKSENNIYLVMEYLNGGSLRRFLDSMTFDTKLDEFSSLQMIRQLTLGVQYLHSQNIVHGDLHSENIMISVENNKFLCKIVDFGNSAPLQQKNNMNDITNLAFHLSQIMNKSQFVRTTIKGNIISVIQMMSNRIFTNMDQVSDQLSKYLPISDIPPPTESVFRRFIQQFKK